MDCIPTIDKDHLFNKQTYYILTSIETSFTISIWTDKKRAKEALSVIRKIY